MLDIQIIHDGMSDRPNLKSRPANTKLATFTYQFEGCPFTFMAIRYVFSDGGHIFLMINYSVQGTSVACNRQFL